MPLDGPSNGPLSDPNGIFLKFAALKLQQQAGRPATTSTPFQLEPSYFAGGGGAGILFNALRPFLHELFGMNTPTPPTQPLPAGGQAVDVTAPNVNPGDTKMGALETFVRRSRMLAAAMKSSATGMATSAGTARGELEGDLSPSNEQEQMLVGMAPMLTAMGIFAPVGPLTSLAESGAARFGAINAAELAARRAAEAQAVPTITGSTATGLAGGAGFGALQTAGEQQLPGADTSVGGWERSLLRNVPSNAGFGALLGAGFGAFFKFVASKGRPMAPLYAARAAAQLENAVGENGGVVPPLITQPGMVIEGKQAIQMPNGKLRWRWTEGESKGKWASAPDEEAQRNYAKNLKSTYESKAAGSPEGQVLSQVVDNVNPSDPSTLPPDLRGSTEQQKMQTIGALWHQRQAGRYYQALKKNPMLQAVYERQLDVLRNMVMDPTLTESERLTAGGRIAALEKIIGQRPTTPGLLPFEQELAAVDLVRKVKPTDGLQGVYRQADELGVANPDLGNRIRQLAKEPLPDAVHDQITARLNSANNVMSRGIKENSNVLVDGKPYKVAGKPQYGLVPVVDMTSATRKVEYKDVAELQPIPKAGQSVKMRDGTLAQVTAVEPEGGVVGATDVLTGQKLQVPIAAIQEIEDAPSSANARAFEEDYLLSFLDGHENVVKTPPVKAVTTTGEAVTVTGTTPKAVEVRTRTGQSKLLPKDAVVPGSQSPEAGKISDFSPGHIPERGNKLLFFRVQPNNVEAFEQGLEKGGLTPDLLRQYVTDRATPGGNLVMTPHVLPPPMESTPARLYGLELPQDAAPMEGYSGPAKAALGALKGKETIAQYFSPVDVDPKDFLAGKFYRIAPELVAKAQRPTNDLLHMFPEEQKDYLRNLINFNEQVDHEVAEHATEIRETKEQAQVAFAANDGLTLAELEHQTAAASQNFVNAQLKAESEQPSLDQLEAEIYGEVGQADPDYQVRNTLTKEGLTNATINLFYSELRRLPASPERTLSDEVMVAPSKNIQGQRLLVVKRVKAGLSREGGTLSPTREFYYSAMPTGPDGIPMREAHQTFKTEQELVKYMQDNGYTATSYKLGVGGYVHGKKPSMTASIRPTLKGTVEAVEEQRKEMPYIQYEGGLTPEQQAAVLEIGEQHKDVTSGETRFLTKARAEFPSTDAADEYLRSKGYVKQDVGSPEHLTDRWESLPSINQLPGTGQEIANVAGKLEDIMREHISLYSRIPDEILEYARQIAHLHEAELGDGPWNKELRLAVGTPTIQDLAPNPDPQSINYEDALLPNLAYQKNFIPNVKVSKVGDLPGAARDLKEDDFNIVPEMHLHGGAPLRTPPDAQFLFADVLGVKSGPTAPAIDKAVLAAEQQKYITQQAENWVKAQDMPASGPQQFSPAKLPLSRYVPTQQIVMVDPDLVDGQVHIKFADGRELTVAPDQVQKSTSSFDQQHFHLGGLVAEGRYAQFFKREPPIGLGKVEQNLGLFGSESPQIIRQAFADQAYQYARKLVGKGTDIQGPDEAIKGLLDLYNRAQWLHTPRAGGAALPIADDVMDAIRAHDPKLEAPFRQAAYLRARGQAGDTPYGDLRAKAQAGLLEPKQEEQLLAARKELSRSFGVPSNVPLGRVVDELAVRGLLDPHVANVATAFQNELGGLFWMDKAGVEADAVKVKIPTIKDLHIGSNLTAVPWKAARRHPMSLLFDSSVRMAQVAQERYNQGLLRLGADLQQNGGYKLGFQSEDAMALRKALDTHETWAEAKEAGVPDKYQYGFEQTRKYLQERLEDHIRYYLARQINPVEIKLDDIAKERAANNGAPGRMETWLRKQGVDLNKITDGFAVLTREWVPGLFEGEKNSTWTHDDIEAFLDLRRKYNSSEELPMNTDQRFIDNFDFWKHYGRKNYFPLIHEGNIALTVERGGEEKVIAWAPSQVDAAMAHRQMLNDGRIAAGEHVRYVAKNDIADDILMRSNIRTNVREWNRMMKAFADHIEADGDDIQAIFLKGNQPEPEEPGLSPVGRLASAEPRKANLQPAFPDLMQDLGVMTGRIARNQYRWKVANAFNRMQDIGLDRSISEAHNLPMLNDMPRLKQLMSDVARRAMGERTGADDAADFMDGLSRWMYQMPREALRKIFNGQEAMPWNDILSPSTYARKFGARTRASQIIAANAIRKLGFNPMSALVNFFQYQQNAIPLLAKEGLNAAEVGAESMVAWKDGIRLWLPSMSDKFAIPKDLEGVAGLIHDIGVDLMPAKQLAGGGMSWGDTVGHAPSGLGKTRVEQAVDMGKWTAMLAFNGGEQTGRFATAVAAIRRSLRAEGIDPYDAAAIKANPAAAGRATAAARRLVQDAYFGYDDLSMPGAFAKLGPMGRLLFQFKPYIVQQIGYEKDLVAALLKNPGDVTALKQFGTHLGMLTAMGGLSGLMYHPVTSYIGGALKLLFGTDILRVAGHSIPLTPQGLETMRDQQRSEMSSPDELMNNSMHYNWDDILYYGLPAIAHLSMGSRVGISGQDIAPDFSSLGSLMQSEAGPTYSTYFNLFQAWSKYIKEKQPWQAVAGGIAGTLLGQQVRTRGAPVPFLGALGGLLGASLASSAGDNPFAKYMETSEEGRRLLTLGMPTMIRNAQRTWEIYSTGGLANLNNEREYFPAENRTEEMLGMFTGAQTIRREEYGAVINFTQAQSARYELNKAQLTDEIAVALRNGDTEAAWNAALRAEEMGVDIPESAVQQRLSDMVSESIQTIQQRQSIATRYWEP